MAGWSNAVAFAELPGQIVAVAESAVLRNVGQGAVGLAGNLATMKSVFAMSSCRSRTCSARTSIAFLLIVFLLGPALCFAHETDEPFVPKKPEKPLRFCSSAKKWVEYASHDSNMVEITNMKGIRMDLRYGTL